MTDLRQAVRERYGRIATESRQGGCCGGTSSCGTADPGAQSERLGYSEAELESLPEGANLGLGCGNPQAIAALRPGETVLDLGSGGGIDCFLAAQQVGPSGRVIGVDMTPEMIVRAREAARKAPGAERVEFRLGEIEHLPVADESVDVIISNCVVNLSVDKPAVYRETYRVLKPGGRIAISDIVATAELPQDVQNDLDAYTGCMAGATSIHVIEEMLRDTGFEQIQVRPQQATRELVSEWSRHRPLEDYLVSATIEAVRPASV
ncbi:MAG TPA: arsenite methyltransferase [Vicinamibacteria bacterium]|nr:arsenite methyltransferase [Vicinamibacteria bacterium]